MSTSSPLMCILERAARTGLAAAVTAALLSAGACTSLGPMPALTGTTPRPADRNSVELQAGALPGHFVSAAVVEEPEGEPVNTGSVLVDAGRLVGLPGLVLGGRYVGKELQGGYPEPLLGYRRYLDGSRRVGAAVMVHGGHGEGEDTEATYEATRIGLEASFDLRATPTSRWVEVHLTASVAIAGLWAKGSYCIDTTGRYGIDCPGEGEPRDVRSASASGVYPAGSLGVAVDAGRHLPVIFHGARLAFHAAAGGMPRVEAAVQGDAVVYVAAGLSLTVAFGATD